MEVHVRLEDTHKIPISIEMLHREYDIVAPLIRKELGAMKVKA
jgi:hypothetical protein